MDLKRNKVASTDLVVINNPMQKALNNQIILANILNTTTNPKGCRLVCKKWNDSILSQDPARLRIIVQNVFQDVFSGNVPLIERKLAKEISVLYPYNFQRSYDGPLETFCKEYGALVEHLKFEGDDFDYLKHILNNHLPNLRSLEGDFIKSKDFGLNLEIMPKLEIIEASKWEVDKEILQLLIKNAPNLQAINYYGPFDLDFSQNDKLKSLSMRHIYRGNLNQSETKEVAEGLIRMLTQTAQSLENLEITFYTGIQELEVQNAQQTIENKSILVPYPTMPKLTTLQLNCKHDSPIGRHFDNLGPNILPNLKYLGLASHNCENITTNEMIFLHELAENKGRFQHSGIVKLSLHTVGNPDLLENLRSFFPNIQSLEIGVISKKNSSLQMLQKLVKVFIDLKLKKIKIMSSFEYDTLELVQALEPNYEQLFVGGLKRFHVENFYANTDTLEKEACNAFENGCADPIQSFEKILLHMKQVQGLEVVFQNFMLNASTAQRILGFVAENKIPITFKN